MEEKIQFECSLFGDGTPDKIIEIDDIDFVINTLVNLSIFRPQKYELIFMLHRKYSLRKGFKEKFLERTLKRNRNFINILIEKNIYNYEEISHYFNTGNRIVDIIDLSNKILTIDYKEDDICQNTIDPSIEMFQNNYPNGTIEYYLKNDDVNEIHRIYQDPSLFQDKANIIRVENIMNLDFNLLGFCGFFGSVKCFKFFLKTHLFTIDRSVVECVVCGGSIEIFRLCMQTKMDPEFFSKLLFLASCFNNLDILRFLHENGADINSKSKDNWTPLHYAADKGHLSVVEYLVNQKADINAKNTRVEFLC